jgi:hypothetical protein
MLTPSPAAACPGVGGRETSCAPACTAMERVMPITPFLAGRPFDQDAIDMMSAAFMAVCGKLGLADRSDPATLIVAEKVVELAQRGISDVDTLRRMALQAFDVVE